VIEPSMGFGTGHHATTRLCLAALGSLDVLGPAVLDVGSGSGVLSFAAAISGAADVRGIDIDGDAVQAARRSASLNPSIPAVRFETGDVFTDPCAPVDLVLANLTGAMLIRSAAHLARLVKPGGRLIVSGFLHDEQDAVAAALDGFATGSTLTEDGWCALVLRRESA
jgi:ribosomal protein L11 methyltransferase